MNTPESLDGLYATFLRRGLPADYAQRAASEIADHYSDLMAELQATGMSPSQATTEAERRLGDERTLVKRTVREYQRRYWCARWPLITFLIGPIPLLFLVWMTTWLVLFCIAWPLEKLGIYKQTAPDGTISFWEYLVNQLLVVVICYAAPAVAMSALVRLVKRAALNWTWIAVSACVLGLVAGMINIGFPEPSLHPTMTDGKPMLADQQVLVRGIPLFAPSFLAAWSWYTRHLR